MLLSEIFEQLTYGELSQVAIGGAPVGEILPEHYSRVTSHINMALTALHTRFLLREEQLILQGYDHISTYNLTYDHAVSNPAVNGLTRYIIDTVEDPFKSNILLIEQVYNEDGDEIPLNDSSNDESLFTPRHNQLQYPTAVNENSISVIYRANHGKLVVNEGTDPEAVQVYLPPSCLQALLYFVSARVLSPMGADAGGNEGDKYMSLYEMECHNIEKFGILAKENNMNNKLEAAGWV